jgi:hypothetical protein
MNQGLTERSHAMHNFSTSTRIVQVAKFSANYGGFVEKNYALMRVCPDLVQERLRKTNASF